MHITRLLSFSGLLLPCMALVPAVTKTDVQLEPLPTILPDIPAVCCSHRKCGGKKSAEYCNSLQPRINHEWNSTDVGKQICGSVTNKSKLRREWQFIIPNIRIFDDIPATHNDQDCGHRLYSELRGLGWRHLECRINENGTANITIRSFLTAGRKSVGKSLTRATCGTLAFQRCYKHDHYY